MPFPLSGVSIEDVRVYARALADSEASSLANAALFASVLASPPESRAPADVDALSVSIGGERKSGRARLMIAADVLGLAAVTGAGYYYYANQVLTGSKLFGMPSRARIAVSPTLPKIPIPSDEELATFFREMRGPVAPLPEIPRDRDELD